jgi:Lar family restriction alleviation protein
MNKMGEARKAEVPETGALLPCPFCGEGPTMESDPPPGYGWWQISCNHCGTLQSEVGSEEEAIKKWNARAVAPVLALKGDKNT